MHSDHSLSEGLCRLSELSSASAEKRIFSVALTDIDNMFGWVKFYQKMRQAGIKPIPGADVIFDLDGSVIKATLLCLNDNGYQQVVRLLSDAYLSDVRIDSRPVVNHQHVIQSDGVAVILHLNGLESLISTQNNALAELLEPFKPLLLKRRLFGSLTRLNLTYEQANYAWTAFAYQYELPLVAVNNVCFMAQADYQAHEIRLCIHQGRVIQDKTRAQSHSKEQYFKSAIQMHEVFSDAKQVLENTNILAKRCNVTLSMGKVYLPEVAAVSDKDFFLQESLRGLERRFSVMAEPPKDKQLYYDRMQREVETITKMGFSSYFLIVADFIKWSKLNQVPVGPGRGSGAGSLVAYALEITDIDPLVYDLLFERFLNPERVSMPDFDIDFCMIGRDRVIDYVAKKYGRLNVSQIITYGRMAAKAVIRDVGRVMGHPYGFVDKLAKLIPFDLGITLEKAMAQEPMLTKRYAEEQEVRQLIDFCLVLEGLVRNVGTHAGGVVIAPSEISDFSPVYRDESQAGIVTQYDKDDIEKIGLVKFDFLGLRTLTIIDWALKNIQSSQGLSIDIATIPLDDKKAFELLQGCLTTGVFQLESQGMKELIDRLVPDCFEDIIALVALYRPGPLQSGMVDDFVKRKHGIDEVVYQHPLLEPILNNTYGVILYQEQVMQIAQDMAGYSLGGADLLRRAMGKKKPEEMEKQREIFSAGAIEAKIDVAIAKEIFDLMEKFAGYGFNKSHSAAYALISYQTAWLKANYTTEFMAAVLSSDMDNTEKVMIFLEDVAGMGISVLSPDINASQQMFSVVKEGVIRYGLSAIKGVGHSIAMQLVKDRPSEGFQDLLDVCASGGKVNKKLLESLIKAGACDVFGQNRATLLASINTAVQTFQRQSSDSLQGQQDLLGGEVSFRYKQVPPMPKRMALQYEKDTLGYYQSGHPVAESRDELNCLGVKRIAQVGVSMSSVRIAGVVNKIKVIKTKKGGRIAFVELSDETGKIDVAFFDEVYTQAYELLSQPGIILAEGATSLDQFTQNTRLQCLKAQSLDECRQKSAPKIEIVLEASAPINVNEIVAKLSGQPGRSEVTIKYLSQDGIAEFSLPFKVMASDALIEGIASLNGVESCCVAYGEYV